MKVTGGRMSVNQRGKKCWVSFLGLIVVGCASAVWDKPGATHADFRGDLDACHTRSEDVIYGQGRVSRTSPGTDLSRGGTAPSDAGMLPQYLSTCLQAKGWKQVSR